MLERAYSTLEIKSIDEEQRIIVGIASTPRPDRDDDIMESKGATFQLPIPLLWHHNAREPIGEVFEATVTADGIRIKARIAKIDEPGTLKDRIDDAWHSLKARLVRGLSVGWRPLERAQITGSFGSHVLKWLWLELSAVTIPANGDASILSIKSIDAHDRAVSGKGQGDVRPTTPGVSGTPVVRLLPSRQEKSMKSLQEQITGFENTRAAKAAERDAIQTKAADEGRTKDAAEKEAFTNLSAELKAIDEELVDLRELQESQKKAAKSVVGTDPAAAHASRGGGAAPVIHTKANVDKGIEFARAVICKVASFKYGGQAIDYAKRFFPDNDRVHLYLKATIPAGLTTPADGTWAGVLVDPTNLESEFIEFLRPQTILGKFGQNGIPALRAVPFNIRVIGQTSGGDAYWVGQGAPKPLTKFDFAATALGFNKVASIAVISDELARFSSPSADRLVRDALAAANIERVDIDFIDPTVSAVANVSPASVTNGVTPLAPSGVTADDARSDFARLIKSFLDNNLDPTNLVVILPTSLALSLSLMRNALGQKEFPDLTMRGGLIEGIPTIPSQYAANRSGAGNLVIAINASEVFLADDGQVTVDASREASLQMLDNPTNSSATGTATTMVSMFQTNSIALRAERTITWAKRRADAVVYMDDVNWGSIGSPA